MRRRISLVLAVIAVVGSIWSLAALVNRAKTDHWEQPGSQLSAAQAKAALVTLMQTPEGREMALLNDEKSAIRDTWGTNKNAHWVGFSLDLEHATYSFGEPSIRPRDNKCGTFKAPTKHFRGVFHWQDDHWVAAPPRVSSF